MQCGELASCLILGGYAGVRILPKVEQLLIFRAALGDVSLHRVGTRQAQVRQRKMIGKRVDAGMIENLPELSRRQVRLAEGQVGASPQVGLVQISQVTAEPGL